VHARGQLFFGEIQAKDSSRMSATRPCVGLRLARVKGRSNGLRQSETLVVFGARPLETSVAQARDMDLHPHSRVASCMRAQQQEKRAGPRVLGGVKRL